MIFSNIPYKIPDANQMSTKTTRQQVYQEIKNCNWLFQVGSGSGSMSLDFLLNGGQEAYLLDTDVHACVAALKNSVHNNVTIRMFNLSVQEYVRENRKKFDAIVVSTAFLNPEDLVTLIDECLQVNGVIIVILKECVINQNSISGLKEVVKKCETKILDPIVNPEDDNIRLIYKGIKNASSISC